GDEGRECGGGVREQKPGKLLFRTQEGAQECDGDGNPEQPAQARPAGQIVPGGRIRQEPGGRERVRGGGDGRQQAALPADLCEHVVLPGAPEVGEASASARQEQRRGGEEKRRREEESAGEAPPGRAAIRP